MTFDNCNWVDTRWQ